MERSIPWLNFLPLAFFMWGPRLFSTLHPLASAWNQPFYWGSAIALTQILYSFYFNISLDYVALGTNLFLLYGAIGSLLHSSLLLPSALLKQSGVFLFILTCGLIVSMIRREGFLQLPEQFQTSSLIGSCGLLGFTILAFGLSYVFVTYINVGPPLALGIPLVSLLTAREVFYEYITRRNLKTY